ncbi:MAG: helix-turn-helix transcriptional regulator [Gemmatimonadaceae bacterium]|nr:helix-turn-helix transcriptional regulator [Gemmatimonadaceae bacterium]
MLDRERDDLALWVELEERVVVEVARLGDRSRLELDVECVRVGEVSDDRRLSPCVSALPLAALELPMAKRTKRTPSALPPAEEGFGPRLARLRRAAGLTQETLGAATGISSRMIAYYEREDAEPPGPLLAVLAQAIGVPADTLRGLAPARLTTRPGTAKLLKRLQRIEELPLPDQRAVLKIVDGLLETHRRTKPSRQKAS